MQHAFNATLIQLLNRISLLTNLHVEGLDRLSLKTQLQQIHASDRPGDARLF